MYLKQQYGLPARWRRWWRRVTLGHNVSLWNVVRLRCLWDGSGGGDFGHLFMGWRQKLQWGGFVRESDRGRF